MEVLSRTGRHFYPLDTGKPGTVTGNVSRDAGVDARWRLSNQRPRTNEIEDAIAAA